MRENVERILFHEQTILSRLDELAQEITEEYRGKELTVVAVLNGSFMFMADLVRAMDGASVVCTFIKPKYSTQVGDGANGVLEIFFSHDLDIRNQHVLLVEGLVHSGVTSEFLMSDLRSRGAASVKLATLLDRQCARRVQLQPDYFGFLVDETFLVGYGLGSAEQTGRNLPFLASQQ